MCVKKLLKWIKENPDTFLAIILILITGYYAQQLNGISGAQLEEDRRPYIYITNLTFGFEEGTNMNPPSGLPGYGLEVINKGSSPAKITRIEIRDSPTRNFDSKKLEDQILLFSDEVLEVSFEKLLNVAGGFLCEDKSLCSVSSNTSGYARVKVFYEWNKKEYSTTRDFYVRTYQDPEAIKIIKNSLDIYLSDRGKITFIQGGQVFDEEAPLDQVMWGGVLETSNSEEKLYSIRKVS